MFVILNFLNKMHNIVQLTPNLAKINFLKLLRHVLINILRLDYYCRFLSILSTINLEQISPIGTLMKDC